MCFASNSEVQLHTGSIKRMSELKLGDQVASGEGRFSPIIAFLHRDLDTQAEYVALTYVVGEQQQTIELTADHRIFVWSNSVRKDVAASDVRVSSVLVVQGQKDQLLSGHVIAVSKRNLRGAFAPLTYDGTVVVNGVLSSCYAYVRHSISHTAFLPLRLLYSAWPQAASALVRFDHEQRSYLLPYASGLVAVFGPMCSVSQPYA